MSDTVTRRDLLTAVTAFLTAMGAAPKAFLRAGTFEGPFGRRSLWNARPRNPVLGEEPIPAENNRAWLEKNKYSTSIFKAEEHHRAVAIHGRDNPSGPWVADELRNRVVLIPHFPENVAPAIGNDGHCEVYDTTTRLLHSFYRLKYDSGDQVWKAGKYTATSIDGSGWGSPAEPDGPRAAGTSTAGGLLRLHEIENEMPRHAIAIGAHANVFRSGPIFPATLEDFGGNKRYSGVFPMGTLFMLPNHFEIDRLVWPNARKIARALMTFGARLVDQTVGTFAIYGEINSTWSQALDSHGAWQSSWTSDLTRIRDALRAVLHTDVWLDSDDSEFVPTPWVAMNLLSMRGPWSVVEGRHVVGSGFETTTKMFLFPKTTEPVRYRKVLFLRDDRLAEPWFQWRNSCWYINPKPGGQYKLRAIGFGNAKASIQIRSRDHATNYVSIEDLGPGQEVNFVSADKLWGATVIFVHKSAGPQAGIRLELQQT